MSKICNGCGGIIGRDCFNPTECEMISQQQDNMNSDNHPAAIARQALVIDNLLQQVADLKQEVDFRGTEIVRWKKEVERLKEGLRENAETHFREFLRWADKEKWLVTMDGKFWKQGLSGHYTVAAIYELYMLEQRLLESVNSNTY